ncbi:MAG: alanine racemase [Bdellovibrionales bacterium]|nr:alanine racemase [Bdellovibrionales bacterium]
MDSESKKKNWAKLRRSFDDRAEAGRGSDPLDEAGAFDDDSYSNSNAPLTARFDRAEAIVSGKALRENFRAIQDQVGDQAILPMIKADAYGHGAAFATKALAQARNLYGFGVASLDEAREIRETLGAKGRRTRVMALSGATNWSDEKGQYCERFGITPTIASDEDWRRFLKGKWPERLKYHLKFNTGMNRLGISAGLVQQILSQLKDKPLEWRPEGVATHMAVAEDDGHSLTKKQLETFRGITSAVKSTWTDTLFHLANSGSIWHAKEFGLDGWTDLVRPGISLYGVPPWPGAPARGLVPAMELRYQVAARRQVKPGESVGYGAHFKVKGSESPVEIAILAAGYADGLHRMNSGIGEGGGRAWLDGRLRRFLGVVSMDLSAIECDASTEVGAWARIFGEGLDPWTQAKAAGTIPYEVLTSVSRRVRRVFKD